MDYAYYPGCSLHSTGREYDDSVTAVFPALNTVGGTGGLELLRRDVGSQPEPRPAPGASGAQPVARPGGRP